MLKTTWKSVFGIILITFLAACSPPVEELVESGRDLMAADKYAEAVKVFNEALEKEPNNYTALNAKGVALLRPIR